MGKYKRLKARVIDLEESMTEVEDQLDEVIKAVAGLAPKPTTQECAKALSELPPVADKVTTKKVAVKKKVAKKKVARKKVAKKEE